jgi:hypothetical protein
LAEAIDLPKRMEAHVDWALAPIAEANALADEINATRGELDVDPTEFNAVCRAAFEGRPPPELAKPLSAEQRHELDALVRRLGTLGADLKSVPKRASAAGLAMVRLGIKMPLVIKSAADEVKANPAASATSLPAILRLPKDLKQVGRKLKQDMKQAPQNAVKAGEKILAALSDETDEGAAASPAAPVDRDEIALNDGDPAHEREPIDEPLPELEPLPEPEPALEEPASADEDASLHSDETLVEDDLNAADSVAPKPDADRPRARGIQIAGYGLLTTGVGLTVGLVSAGYVRGIKGYDGYVAATTPEGQLERARQYDSGRAMIISGAVTGTLLTAAGIVLVVVDAVREKKRRFAFAPSPSVAGLRLVITGKF